MRPPHLSTCRWRFPVDLSLTCRVTTSRDLDNVSQEEKTKPNCSHTFCTEIRRSKNPYGISCSHLCQRQSVRVQNAHKQVIAMLIFAFLSRKNVREGPMKADCKRTKLLAVFIFALTVIFRHCLSCRLGWWGCRSWSDGRWGRRLWRSHTCQSSLRYWSGRVTCLWLLLCRWRQGILGFALLFTSHRSWITCRYEYSEAEGNLHKIVSAVNSSQLLNQQL